MTLFFVLHNNVFYLLFLQSCSQIRSRNVQICLPEYLQRQATRMLRDHYNV